MTDPAANGASAELDDYLDRVLVGGREPVQVPGHGGGLRPERSWSDMNHYAAAKTAVVTEILRRAG